MASTVWRGTIAFGLVSIPVRLVRAARRERIQFRHVHKAARDSRSALVEQDPEPDVVDGVVDGVVDDAVETVAPVQRVHTVEAEHGSFSEAIQPQAILKGFEVAPNRYVTFRPEEVKAVKPKSSTSIEITSFVRLEKIDPMYFDASYYVVPQPAGEKPYSILFGSLRHSNLTALGQMAMHGREHAVVIRTGAKGLILETLFYRNEVHLEDQYQANPELAALPELKMAEAFIKVMTTQFDPEELVDRYEQRMRALIDARAEEASPERITKPESAAPVVDIMEALRKSLEQVRKPAVRETSVKQTAVKQTRTKRTRAS